MFENVISITIITDCFDPNAVMRQSFRLATLMLKSRITGLIGVENDLAAAGNLIDTLDASEGRKSIVIVNAAPRNGKAKKWPNGTPFCYFFYGETLVISTIDGLTLSLVKKLGLVEKVNLLDIPQVVKAMVKEDQLDPTLVDKIIKTQFRSYDFVPRLAKWLIEKQNIPSEEYLISEIPDPPTAIWWIDNFGNCKTTLFLEETDLEASHWSYAWQGIQATYHPRLKDVPDNQQAVVVGSSGIKKKRFLEIVHQGGNAAKHFGLNTGDILLPRRHLGVG